MINEIVVQLQKEDNHIWLLHLWEHCVIRNFERKLLEQDLDDQGIIINGRTFLDATTIEIFYPEISLKSRILSIITQAMTDISSNLIENEIPIITDEISYIDIDDEEKTIYDGLRATENDNILNLYESIDFPVEKISDKFSELVNYVKVAEFSDDKLDLKERSSSVRTKRVEDDCAVSKNSNFLSLDIKLWIKDTREYLIGYFLAFMIGMTEDSIVQKRYLSPNNKYLGYTQYIMYNGNAHILLLIDVKNIDRISIMDILPNGIFSNMSPKNFRRQLNGFKTYIGLYLSKYDLCKDILKIDDIPNSFSIEHLLSDIDTITIDDIQEFYERVKFSDLKKV